MPTRRRESERERKETHNIQLRCIEVVTFYNVSPPPPPNLLPPPQNSFDGNAVYCGRPPLISRSSLTSSSVGTISAETEIKVSMPRDFSLDLTYFLTLWLFAVQSRPSSTASCAQNSLVCEDYCCCLDLFQGKFFRPLSLKPVFIAFSLHPFFFFFAG